MEPAQEEMLKAAAEFLWGDAFLVSLDGFTDKHVASFVGAGGAGGEQKLEWTVLHKEFQAMFEGQLEAFVDQQGGTLSG
jgi:hypothetical protein